MEVRSNMIPCFPDFPNTTCWVFKPTTKLLVFDIAMFSTSVLTVVLNLFIIISVSHFRQLHTPTNILLLSLAVSDFLVGLVLMPFHTIVMSHCWYFSQFVCSLFKFVTLSILSASAENVMLISVDRYMAICDPLHYTTRVTVSRAKFCVCLSWFFSLIKGFPFFVLQIYTQIIFESCIGSCESLVNSTGAYIRLFLNFIVPVSVIVVLYLTVFVVAVSQARAMRSHVTAVTKQISVTKTAKKSELKAARTLGVLVLVFIVCLLPTFCITVGGGHYMSYSGIYFTQYLYTYSSFLNPVIYALFYPWFRKAVKLIVTLQILQPGSCEANVL